VQRDKIDRSSPIERERISAPLVSELALRLRYLRSERSRKGSSRSDNRAGDSLGVASLIAIALTDRTRPITTSASASFAREDRCSSSSAQKGLPPSVCIALENLRDGNGERLVSFLSRFDISFTNTRDFSQNSTVTVRVILNASDDDVLRAGTHVAVISRSKRETAGTLRAEDLPLERDENSARCVLGVSLLITIARGRRARRIWPLKHR